MDFITMRGTKIIPILFIDLLFISPENWAIYGTEN
jgi:hypothetical protein